MEDETRAIITAFFLWLESRGQDIQLTEPSESWTAEGGLEEYARELTQHEIARLIEGFIANE